MRFLTALLGTCLLLAACFFEGGGSETEYLTGKVTLPDGNWAPKARITIRPADYLADTAVTEGPTIRDLVANAAGIFKVGGLPPGDYCIEMRQGDELGAIARLTLRKGKDTTFTRKLENLGRVKVRITDPSAGPQAFMQVFGMERRVVTDADRWLTVALPPGEYRLRLGAGESQDTALRFSQVRVRPGLDSMISELPIAALKSKPPVPVIFDANPSFAPDDFGALAILHALMDLGETRILATGTSLASRSSAATLDIINTHYGRGSLPVGAWKGGPQATTGSFDTTMAAEFSHDVPAWESLPSAAALYRQTLAAQPDSSVTVVAVGGLHNLWTLLRADRDLVSRKVKILVAVGGAYPSGSEFNFVLGIAKDTLPNVTAEVVQAWPTPVVFHGDEAGRGVDAGTCLGTAPPSPVRRAYELGTGTMGGKALAADLAAVLFAVRGAPPHWKPVTGGRNEVAADGSNKWIADPGSDQAYLERLSLPAALGAELDTLLCREPRR